MLDTAVLHDLIYRMRQSSACSNFGGCLMCVPPPPRLQLLLSLLPPLLLLLLLPLRLLSSPLVVAKARQHGVRLGQVLLHLLAAVEDWAVPRCAQHILQSKTQESSKHGCSTELMTTNSRACHHCLLI